MNLYFIYIGIGWEVVKIYKIYWDMLGENGHIGWLYYGMFRQIYKGVGIEKGQKGYSLPKERENLLL